MSEVLKILFYFFKPCRYDSRNSILEWSILLIDNSNRRFVNSEVPFAFNLVLDIIISSTNVFCFHHLNIGSGSMEFVVPPADSSVFFPISVRFTAAKTFSDLKVCVALSTST